MRYFNIRNYFVWTITTVLPRCKNIKEVITVLVFNKLLQKGLRNKIQKKPMAFFSWHIK